MIGYFLIEMGQMLDKRDECLQLLQYMVDLAAHMKKLRRIVPQEKDKLKNAIVITVKGSMLYAKQLYSKNIFRFMKCSIDSQNLHNVSSPKIEKAYKWVNEPDDGQIVTQIENQCRPFIEPLIFICIKVSIEGIPCPCFCLNNAF